MPAGESANRPDSSTIYRTLVEHMNEAVWMGDKHERTIYANPKFCELMERSLQEMLGKESYIFWDKESAKRVRRANETERRKGIASSYEGTLLSKSGKRIPVLLSGTPIPQGGTIGIMTDLRELRKHESLYRTLVEHMNEAVWMGDKHERTIYANPKFCELMEYSLQEMLGKESYEFWDKESSKRVRRVNLTDRRQGTASSYEGTLVSKTGNRIPVLLSGTPLPEGGTIGIMTDLRELKKKEEKERVLSSAIMYGMDAVIEVDSDGKIRSWNRGAKTIFGYSTKEMENCSLDTIFSPADRKDIMRVLTVRYNIQFHGMHKNKQPVTVSVTISPIIHMKGTAPSSFLLIVRDMTAQRKFEEELMVKYQKMREAYNRFGIIRRQTDYIFDFVSLSSQQKDRRVLADYIVNSVIMLSRADGCVLRFYNKRYHTLELASFFGVGEDWRGKAHIHLKGSLVEKAFKSGMPLKIVDLTKEPGYSSTYLAKKHNFCSSLILPLVFRSEIIGSLSLYVTPEKKLELFENDFIEQYALLIGCILASSAPAAPPAATPR
jgi:PAS domain S-box-containing protein